MGTQTFGFKVPEKMQKTIDESSLLHLFRNLEIQVRLLTRHTFFRLYKGGPVLRDTKYANNVASTSTLVEAEVSFNISFSSPPTPPDRNMFITFTNESKSGFESRKWSFTVQNWCWKQDMELSKQNVSNFYI